MQGAVMELQINTYVDADHTVLAVAGELDVYTAPALRTEIGDRLASGQNRLVIDLTDVEFVDSTGLGILVAGLTASRDAGGDLALVCSRPSLLKLLKITGLDEVFAVHPTAAEATAGHPAV
jgi:anti-sigma B factor antagonist